MPSVEVVYELNKKGVLTLLHSFSDSERYGAYPYGGLVRDAKGNFYGTTAIGSLGYGTVWKITK